MGMAVDLSHTSPETTPRELSPVSGGSVSSPPSSILPKISYVTAKNTATIKYPPRGPRYGSSPSHMGEGEGGRPPPLSAPQARAGSARFLLADAFTKSETTS